MFFQLDLRNIGILVVLILKRKPGHGRVCRIGGEGLLITGWKGKRLLGSSNVQEEEDAGDGCGLWARGFHQRSGRSR